LGVKVGGIIGQRAAGMENLLTWDDSYAIALALKECYPGVRLEDVSLGMINRWTLALPNFDDDPQLTNDSILMAIYQEWIEEVYSP
jgi:FeS assembly protein IscX